MHGQTSAKAENLGFGGPGPLARYWPVALIAALTVLSRAPYFGDLAPSFDEQLYNLIGHHMLSGSLPYVDLWDRKPIGLFLIFAFANAIAAPLGISGALAYEWLATGFTLAGALIVWRLATRLQDGPAAAIAGALYPFLMANYGSQAGQSEAFHVPIMLGMLLLAERGLWAQTRGAAVKLFLGAMALGGIGLQVKYTVVPQCLFLGGLALWSLHRRGLRVAALAGVAAAFGALGLLPTAAAWLAYWSAGHGEAFVFANFVSIFDRGAPPGTKLERTLPRLVTVGFFALPGIAALIDRRKRPSPHYLLYAGWTLSCFLGLYMGSTVYGYYFAALVPGALLLAVPMLSLFGPATLVLLMVAVLAYYDLPSRFAASQHSRAALHKLTELVKPHVGARDRCLYVFDGPSALYDTTGSCLPTRFIYPDHLNNNLERYSLGIDQAAEVRRIFANRPGAVVTADHAVTVQNEQSHAVLDAELARGYRPLGTVRFNNRTLTVHVRKDEAG